MARSPSALWSWPGPRGSPSRPQLTFREEHSVQPETGPALQAGWQLGEVIAVQVEDHLQGLPAALDVVEDVGVCGGPGDRA